MLINEIKTKRQWESLAQDFPERTFLQSWSWGQFQQKLGLKVWRLAVFQKQNCLALAQVIKMPILKRLNCWFLYAPHGPLLKSFAFAKSESRNSKFETLEYIIRHLIGLGRKEQAAFLRVGPILKDNQENRALFRQLGFKRAPIHIHTENSWLLNLDQDQQQLWRSMRKGHRYSIRRAERANIKILNSKFKTNSKFQYQNSKHKLKEFYNLYRRLADRAGFSPFSWEYIKNEFEVFSNNNQIKLFWAEMDNQMIAGALIVFYGPAAFYHHSASEVNLKAPVTHLLLWKAIKEAKKQGREQFNFWGIVPKDARQGHPWQGLSFFKQGFGGRRIDYLPTQDLPLDYRYWFNRALELIRSKKRRF